MKSKNSMVKSLHSEEAKSKILTITQIAVIETTVIL